MVTITTRYRSTIVVPSPDDKNRDGADTKERKYKNQPVNPLHRGSDWQKRDCGHLLIALLHSFSTKDSLLIARQRQI